VPAISNEDLIPLDLPLCFLLFTTSYFEIDYFEVIVLSLHLTEINQTNCRSFNRHSGHPVASHVGSLLEIYAHGVCSGLSLSAS